MKHKNGKTGGKNTVTTVSLTREEAEKLINGLFKHDDIKPVYISDYDGFQRGFDFLMQELRNWSKTTTSETDDILIKSRHDLYPLPFKCHDLKIHNAIRVQLQDKTYDGYYYNSSVEYIFEGTVTTRMGKTHKVHIQYNPYLVVNFVPHSLYLDDNGCGTSGIIYKVVYLINKYFLEVTVDDNILYTRDGEADENFQDEIDEKIKRHIENTTLEILEGTIEGISWE